MTHHTTIIGGTKGAGRELARRLLKQGRTVSVVGRSPVNNADQDWLGASFFPADITSPEEIDELFTSIVEQRGPIHSLAFFQRHKGNTQEWENQLNVSLTATKNTIERAVQAFAPGEPGYIALVGSIAGEFISSSQPASYHVAKAGMNQLVRYYATTLGPKGIRVNAVSPATFIKEESREYYEGNKELMDLYARTTPLGRMCTSEDIASVVEFLCGPGAGFVTGQNIYVDGGVSLVSQEALARNLSSI